MANVLVRLLKAYRRHGFRVRTGLNPLYFGAPDSAFTHFQTDRGVPMSVGGGLAPQEIHFLECLLEGNYRPRNILVIGNAFGWSALALAFLLPEARVVAIDAGLEGDATDLGASLTHDIAREEGVTLRVVNALSPRDVTRVVASEFGGSLLDFVLVDGFHTNEQLARDFAGVVPHASGDCVFAFHDVLHWHMLEAFNGLSLRETCERRILTRCPSGMGVVFPSKLDEGARDAIDAFCDETVDLAAFHATLGATAASPGPLLTERLAPSWKLRRLGMASTYEMEGKADLAEEQLRLAIAEACSDADTQVQLAAYHIARAHDGEACSLLEQASTLSPSWAVPPCELGAMQFRLGNDHAAIAYLERAVGLDPCLVAAHHLLGLAKGRSRGHLAAVADLERAVALDPTCAFTQYDLGLVKFHIEDDAAAIVHLERAVVIAPDWAPPHHILGLARRRLGDNLAARLRLERAVALDPNCAPAWYDLGLVTSHLHDDQAAITHLERAIAVAPEWAPAWRQAGACAARLERWNEAAIRLTRASELGYSDEALWKEIAEACAKAGEWSRALDAFRHARRTTSESRALDKEIAICLRALGRLAESESVLVEAISAQPEWAGAHFELGRTCEALHEWERAEHAFQRAAELRPVWQEARDALGRARECRTRAVATLPLAG